MAHIHGTAQTASHHQLLLHLSMVQSNLADELARRLVGGRGIRVAARVVTKLHAWEGFWSGVPRNIFLILPILSMASKISCAPFYSAAPSSDNSCTPCPFAHSVYSISCSGACALPQTEGRSTRPPVSSSRAPERWHPRTYRLPRGDSETARRAVQARTYGRQRQFTTARRGSWPCSGVVTLTYPTAIISPRGRSAPPFSSLTRPLACRSSPATSRIVASSADETRGQRNSAVVGGRVARGDHRRRGSAAPALAT